MVISTVLVAIVAVHRWKWGRLAVYAVFGLLGLIDLTFMASNALKVVQGGWLPLAVAAGVFVVMDTWRVGRRLHLEKVRDSSLALDLFLERADKMNQRVAARRCFLSARSDVVPNALLHSMKHYKVIHERIVLATVTVADTPFAPRRVMSRWKSWARAFFAVRFVYGFFETPDIPEALVEARAHGLAIDMDSSTFFLGRGNPGAGRSSQPEPLARQSLHVAGVQRPVTGAILSSAGGARCRTGHAGHYLRCGLDYVEPLIQTIAGHLEMRVSTLKQIYFMLAALAFASLLLTE